MPNNFSPFGAQQLANLAGQSQSLPPGSSPVSNTNPQPQVLNMGDLAQKQADIGQGFGPDQITLDKINQARAFSQPSLDTFKKIINAQHAVIQAQNEHIQKFSPATPQGV